jgi:hypothetical protein
MNEPGHIKAAALGEDVGTLIDGRDNAEEDTYGE